VLGLVVPQNNKKLPERDSLDNQAKKRALLLTLQNI
jgi:hypothetical protein